ncbi:MAG: DegT/DnrJ/EryC1/StrS family aminotransferase [Candidatus Nanopelagicales bacterium]|nr:DegT/DnrJ/EryC1/StrS family aminotransferase [Candidatus Nanopelagicales bacterium]
MSPYKITADFEAALCEYTGAPFAVAVNSCTAALLLAVEWFTYKWVNLPRDGIGFRDQDWETSIPEKTYCSVPQAISRAGARVFFREEQWRGAYQLKPLPIWDCARRFTSGMYVPGQFQCVSFAASKILGAEQGGAILHDNAEADAWFRRMRFDGRTEGVDPLEDTFDLIGHHCMMLPSVAATLLVRLYHLPKVNADLPEREYPDLSKHPAFK